MLIRLRIAAAPIGLRPPCLGWWPTVGLALPRWQRCLATMAPKKKKSATKRKAEDGDGSTADKKQAAAAAPAAAAAAADTTSSSSSSSSHSKDGKDSKAESGVKDGKEGKEGPKMRLHWNESGVALGYSILFVRDVEKSKKFYQDFLGAKVRYPEHASAEWTELDFGTTALALHKTPEASGGGGGAAAPFAFAPGIGGPGFFVKSLDHLHKKATELGVTVQNPPKREPWGGYKADYLDLDNIPISVVEFTMM